MPHDEVTQNTENIKSLENWGKKQNVVEISRERPQGFGVKTFGEIGQPVVT